MSEGHRHPGLGLEETHAASAEQYCPSCDLSYGPEAGFRLSFAACLALVLARLALAAVALPASPGRTGAADRG